MSKFYSSACRSFFLLGGVATLLSSCAVYVPRARPIAYYAPRPVVVVRPAPVYYGY